MNRSLPRPLTDKARRAASRSFALRLAVVSTACLLCTALWLVLDRGGAETVQSAGHAGAGASSAEPVPAGGEEEQEEPEFLLPPYHTHTRHQRFLHKKPAPGLPPAEFARLRRHLLVSPLLTRPNGLDVDNFGATSGVLAYFSAAGSSVLRDCPLFEPLSPFFDAVRLPGANAFTLNVLTSRPAAVAPPAEEGVPTAEAEEETSAGVHCDNTLASAMPQGWNGEAHQTDVLYVQIPSDMRRGTLQLWQPDLSGGRESSLEWLGAEEEEGAPELPHLNGTCRVSSWYGPPAEVVVPSENELISFRGDSFHRVLKHDSSDPGQGGWRVSLVLEQYKVQPELLGDLPAFHVHAQDFRDEEWEAENEALQPCRHLLHALEDLTYEPQEEEEAAEQS